MGERSQVAAGVLGRVQGALWTRNLTAQERLQRRPAEGAAWTTAELRARLLSPAKDRIGHVRVRVMVPSDPGDPVRVNLRWTRDLYGFWFDKTVDLEPLDDADEADLTAVEMVLTVMGWTASGAVPLRSMIRTFHKVRKSGTEAA